MVICKSRKFIFLRVPKNASTSLATFFVKGYCGPDDIYSAIGDSGVKSSNFPSDVQSKYREGYRMIHMTLNEIIESGLIDESFARQCKVMGVIRDPFDRQLSLYFFLNRSKKQDISPENFRENFINGYCESDLNNKILQSDYLKIGDEDVGDWWLYDDLDYHLTQFKEQYPTDKELDLQNYKSTFRKNIDKQQQIDYYYDKKTKQAVEDYYAKDFELIERLKNGRS